MNDEEAIRRTVDIIRRRHYSLATERCYVAWLRRYIGFLKVDRHGGTSEEKMERFLTVLAREGIAASTQNQAFNAIRFFYADVLKLQLGSIRALRAKVPQYVRTAPDRETTARFLAGVEDVNGYRTRLVVGLLYGMGLRLCEPLSIRIKDINLLDNIITLRGAKGKKDRVRSIPSCLIPALKSQMVRARVIFDDAKERNIPTQLPGAYAKRCPAAEHSWGWFWLFPSKTPCRDERRDNREVWWHMHEANVQRACRAAAAKIGMEGVITPHVLRHAWATHALQAGANIKMIQEALGHESLETTSIYVHDSTEIKSPLDMLVSGIRSTLPSTTDLLPR